MKILGLDPGLVHTGWCVVTASRLGAHGTIVPPKQCNTNQRKLGYLLEELREVVDKYMPDKAVVEEVVWQGRRRRILLPLAHMAGAIIGMLVESRDLDVLVLTPSMKDTRVLKLRGRWTEHEQDAARLALRAQRAFTVVDPSHANYTRVSVAERTIIAGRIVRGWHINSVSRD